MIFLIVLLLLILFFYVNIWCLFYLNSFEVKKKKKCKKMIKYKIVTFD